MVLLHLQQQKKSLTNTFLLAVYTVKKERERGEREREGERRERQGRGVKGVCVCVCEREGKYKLTCTCSVVIKSVKPVLLISICGIITIHNDKQKTHNNHYCVYTSWHPIHCNDPDQATVAVLQYKLSNYCINHQTISK